MHFLSQHAPSAWQWSMATLALTPDGRAIDQLDGQPRVIAAVKRGKKIAHLLSASVVHRKALKAFREASSDSTLGKLLSAYPVLWATVLTPFVSAGWNASARLSHIAEHCRIMDRLGAPFNITGSEYVDLLRLSAIEGDYKLMLDQPSWLLRDGLLTISLWDGTDRLFSLSFCLAEQNGRRIAYVGGVQGRRGEGVLDRYRAFTKAAFGLRPRDMMVEMFRILCLNMGVEYILGVSNRVHYHKSDYFRRLGEAPALDANYDEMWIDRGGMLEDNGFFRLAAQRVDRAADAIPARKRAMYAQRYAFLNGVADDMAEALRGKLTVQDHQPAAPNA